MNTRKKVKVIGTQEYINKTTGEIEEMNVISIEERDANFHKIWLEHIIASIELIGNQKIKVAFWIIENLDKENKLTYSLQRISKETGASYQTVQKTIKSLIDTDFLIKQSACVYIVNPDIIFKGGKNERMNVMFKYYSEKEIKKPTTCD